MKPEVFLKSVRALPGVDPNVGADSAAFAELERVWNLRMPGEHAELLRWSNGIEVFHGCFRLFGLGPGASQDAVVWNQDDYWKFAWGGRASGYWCFGETAWGDQYAYSVESLEKGTGRPIYILDAHTMRAEVIAESFEEFIDHEFLRCAREPYDKMTVLALRRFGTLRLDCHFVYVPSLLLGGSESLDRVQTMNARAAMICNGDLAIQLHQEPSDRAVTGVETYEDHQGRMRLRIIRR